MKNTPNRGQMKSSDIHSSIKDAFQFIQTDATLKNKVWESIWHYGTANKSHTFEYLCDIMIAKT